MSPSGNFFMANKYFFLLVLFFISCDAKKIHRIKDYKGFKGRVTNEETAINIALANWYPIYGRSVFRNQPFKARAVNDSIWIIYGSISKKIQGGVPYATGNAINGEVIKIWHTK